METVFSPDRIYRYTLSRKFQPSLVDPKPGYVNFCMLNPSTADEAVNDPTVTRCCNYAQAWGFSQLVVTNIFAFRATDPKVMKSQSDPVGCNNDFWIFRTASFASRVICAWGTHGAMNCRGDQVRLLLKPFNYKLHYLKLTAAGHPQHPLYLRSNLQPTRWS